jgi:hypothetical protein
MAANYVVADYRCCYIAIETMFTLFVVRGVGVESEYLVISLCACYQRLMSTRAFLSHTLDAC